jgi:hypothetical protein
MSTILPALPLLPVLGAWGLLGRHVDDPAVADACGAKSERMEAWIRASVPEASGD